MCAGHYEDGLVDLDDIKAKTNAMKVRLKTAFGFADSDMEAWLYIDRAELILSSTFPAPVLKSAVVPDMCDCSRNRRDDAFCNQCGRSNRRTRTAYESVPDVEINASGRIYTVKGYGVNRTANDMLVAYLRLKNGALDEACAARDKMQRDLGAPVMCRLDTYDPY